MRRKIVKRYSKGDVTVIWQPDLCSHSAICFHGLPQVFDPRRRPWIVLDGATGEEVVAQVERCPSGALSWQQSGSEAGAERAGNPGKSTARRGG